MSDTTLVILGIYSGRFSQKVGSMVENVYFQIYEAAPKARLLDNRSNRRSKK